MLKIKMGKNHMIYFNENSEELLGEVAGRGTLINELIAEHFSRDEDTLRRKVDMAEQEFNALNARLKLKVEQREELLHQQKKIKKQTEWQIQRTKDIDKMKKKLENKEITEDEYFEFFD